ARRTLWGIAQGADELSQSNFVTGVFADIRAKHTATAAERGGRHGTPKRVVVTAAAYGDASLYNRRNGSARTAASVGAGAATGGGAATSAASTSLSGLGVGRKGCIDLAARDAAAAAAEKRTGERLRRNDASRGASG
ncbi:unnamed protein product, partial [Scytosiphon promiscuus]